MSLELNATPRVAVALLSLCLGSAAAAPPLADVRNVPTSVHGLVINDPYRWLEDVKNPEALAWMQAQGAHARSLLDRIDGRDAIGQRLAELSAAQGDSIRRLMLMPGDRLYYLKRAVGERQFKLVLRQGVAGAERVLVDPEVDSRRTGVPHAID